MYIRGHMPVWCPLRTEDNLACSRTRVDGSELLYEYWESNLSPPR